MDYKVLIDFYDHVIINLTKNVANAKLVFKEVFATILDEESRHKKKK